MKNVKPKAKETKEERRLVSAEDAIHAALTKQGTTPHPQQQVSYLVNPTNKLALADRHSGRIKKAIEEHSNAIIKSIGSSQPVHRALSDWVKQVVDPFNSPRCTMPYACFTGNVQTCTLGTRFFIQQLAGFAGWMAFSPVYANDMTSVWYTTTGYSGTNNIYTAGGGVGIASATLSNGPYSKAQLLTAPTPTVNDATVYGRWNACAVRCRNVSPVINEGGSGFMGVTATGSDSVNITDASYVSLVELSHTAKDINTRGEWNVLHVTPQEMEDYEFRDEHIPFPRFSDAKVFVPAATEFDDTQVYPVFIYLSPQATPQTYEVEISFVVDYLTYGSQWPGGAPSQIQVQPASKILPHDPFALNILPALQSARQAQPDSAHHTGSRAKDFGRSVKNFFKGVGRFIENPVHEVEAGMGVAGAAGAASKASAVADAIGDALSFMAL